MNIDWGDLFKGLVWDNLIKAAIGRLFAAAPWLAWGPLGWLSSFVITYVADLVYEELQKFVDLQFIAFRNAELRDAYSAAANSLKTIALAKGVDSEEFKKARNEQKEALSKFVRFAVAR